MATKWEESEELNLALARSPQLGHTSIPAPSLPLGKTPGSEATNDGSF